MGWNEGSHIWSPEDDEFIRAKLAEGFSNAQIAALFRERGINVTRNAVIGRAMRKGLGKSGVRQGYQPRRKDKIPTTVPAAKAAEIVTLPAPKPVPKKKREKAATLLPFQPPGKFETQVLIPEAAQCRWIDGDVRLGTAMFCASAKIYGSSYCLHHHKRAWVPVSEREQRRPMSSGFFRLSPMKANKK